MKQQRTDAAAAGRRPRLPASEPRSHTARHPGCIAAGRRPLVHSAFCILHSAFAAVRHSALLLLLCAGLAPAVPMPGGRGGAGGFGGGAGTERLRAPTRRDLNDTGFRPHQQGEPGRRRYESAGAPSVLTSTPFAAKISAACGTVRMSARA